MNEKRDPWREQFGFNPNQDKPVHPKPINTDAMYQTKRLGEILAKFRPSLVKRSVDRLDSIRKNEDGWIVLGDMSKGDAYPEYFVNMVSKKYVCSCHEHFYGDVRQAQMCSHILAVIIYRYIERGARLP